MEEEKTEKKHSKLTSAKLWVTIWAIGLVSFIVIANRTEFMSIAQPLCFVPLGYLALELYGRKRFTRIAQSEIHLQSVPATIFYMAHENKRHLHRLF